MKRSYQPLLIALILLPSAVPSREHVGRPAAYDHCRTFDYAWSPSLTSRLPAQPGDTVDLRYQHSPHKDTPLNPTTAPRTETPAATAAHGQNDVSATPTLVIAISAAFSCLATLLIAFFNYRLVGATRDLHKATEAALHINRPFLLVTDIRRSERPGIVDFNKAAPCGASALELLKKPTGVLTFRVELRNFGVSPADIKDYCCEADAFDPPKLHNGMKDPVVVYQDSQCNRLNNSLIAPNEVVGDRLFATISFSAPEGSFLMDDTKRVAIHGRIRYRGAADFTYVTRFFWWYFPDTDLCHRANTEELNSHT